MKEYLKKITIVLISYNSTNKIKRFIKKIPQSIKIIIIDNSKDFNLKNILKNKKNVKIFFNKNNGYGASINYAFKKIKTPYFLVAQPDVIGIKEKSLLDFYKYSKKLKDCYSVIGPHFKKASKKGHYQTDLKFDIKRIHNVHGSTMFFNKKTFTKIKGFDDNIFLYWEETDYTKRALKKGYNAYQLNKVKVIHEKGKAVITKNLIEKMNLENLYTWHFIWSKYYYYNKHYGRILSLLLFTPVILRILLRLMIHKKNKKKFLKYFYRWDGLKQSILLKKSSMRLDKL